MREVLFENTLIHYELTYKRVKNINMRIKSDCTVSVSANRRVPVSKIDEFVVSQGQFVLKALNKYSEIQKRSPKLTEFLSGERLTILGRNLILRVSEGSCENVESDGVFLYLTVKNEADFKRKKLLTDRWINALCQDVFSETVREVHEKFRKYDVPFSQIKIRNMKSRWGSCQPKSGIITLNSRLIETPRNCIEYVVLHEFCHFIHPNHSKNFYAFVEMMMPDWKLRKKMLESRTYAKNEENIT